MSLLNLARADTIGITTDLFGFGDTVVFTSPDGVVVSVTARPNRHHLKFDSDGAPVNGLVASVEVAEAVLVAAGYPVRNLRGQVAMMKHLVAFKDSTGVLRKYSIAQQYPDDTLGLLVFQLSEFE